VHNASHSKSNALCSWLTPDKSVKGYGAGPTRQLVASDKVEFISDGAVLKLYAPLIDKYNLLFIHKLHPKILIFGKNTKEIPQFSDRLHLKLASSMDEFKRLIDPKTATLKKDGASAYFVRNEKNTTLWSPRTSKETGRNIEYSMKVPEIYNTKGVPSVGMGELVFLKKGKVMKAHEIGGILNSDKIRPLDVVPRLYIYRIDKWNGVQAPKDFFANRSLQKMMTDFIIRIPPFVKIKMINGEGIVGVPFGGSLEDGVKLKFWGDENDWQITSNELKLGPTGRSAGAIVFKSLDSGKEFRIGPGQLGNEGFVKPLIGVDLSGKVAKIKSKRGHEGRSAKFIEFHLDKGSV